MYSFAGGAHVCFVCEYDAVPQLGHAAGHNLCSETSIAAAIAIKTCIQQGNFGGKVKAWPHERGRGAARHCRALRD